MKIVPASQFTLEELTGLYNETRADYMVPMQMTAAAMARYIHVYDISLDTSTVLLDDGKPRGLLMVGLRKHRAWITRLGVTRKSRGKRAAYTMVSHTVSALTRTPARKIMLEVISGNIPARRLFEQFGFAPSRRLLILSRPAKPFATPPQTAILPATWSGKDHAIRLAGQRTAMPPWTNQVESLRNAGNLSALTTESPDGDSGAWLIYKNRAQTLSRIIAGSHGSLGHEHLYSLIAHLHTHHSNLPARVENIPADDPCRNQFTRAGYRVKFERIEMQLQQ